MGALITTFGIDWHLLATQAINFAIVLIALWYFLYRPLLAIVEKRQETLAKGVEDAAKAGQMLAEADGKVSEKLTGAESEAERITKDARAAAVVERTRIVKEAEARAASVEKDAEARAKEDAARMRRESEKEIARLAVLAAAKVVGEK